MGTDRDTTEKIVAKGFELGLIQLPDSIIEFNPYGTSITEFEVPASVKVVGQLPETLEKVSFRGVPEEIGYEAFAKTKLTSIVIPEGVKIIGESAFAECKNLKTVTLPNSVTTIKGARMGEIDDVYSSTYEKDGESYSAFYRCSALEAITLPSGLEVIEAYLFNGCKNLKKVVIPEGVKSINARAFRDCISLESVSLPSTLKTIRFGAFYNTPNLKELIIPESIKSIEFPTHYYLGNDLNSAFEGCSKLNLATQARLKKLGYTDSF